MGTDLFWVAVRECAACAKAALGLRPLMTGSADFCKRGNHSAASRDPVNTDQCRLWRRGDRFSMPPSGLLGFGEEELPVPYRSYCTLTTASREFPLCIWRSANTAAISSRR